MFELPALITGLALIFYTITVIKVGAARGKYGVKAPATSGHDMFERALRVQMNTLEQIVFFLPSLWLFAVYLNAPQLAAGLGALWILGRILYARGYVADPAKRAAGFILSQLAAIVLLLGGLTGVIMRLMA
jgi:glutathione S-transferase